LKLIQSKLLTKNVINLTNFWHSGRLDLTIHVDCKANPKVIFW